MIVTRFHSTGGVGRVIDFMPVGKDAAECTQHGIVRRIQTIRGTMTFRLECRPSFNYGRDTHTISVNSGGAIFQSRNLSLRLGATIPLQQQGDALIAEFTLHEGERVDVCLQGVQSDNLASGFCPETHAEELFTQTVGYWRTWLSKCTYSGRWREMVHRSAWC